MPSLKHTFSKPASTGETSELHLGVSLYEGDAHAPEPGKLYGSFAITDHARLVIASGNITPDIGELFRAGFDQLKAQEFANLGVVTEEIPDPEPPAAEDPEPAPES